MEMLKQRLATNLGIDTNPIGDELPTGTFYLDELNFYINEKEEVIYRSK